MKQSLRQRASNFRLEVCDEKQRAEERGNGLTIPSVGDTFSLGDAEVTVIAVNSVPDDTNNTSIVLRIVYGETSFLFTGDAEEPAEDVILQSGQDIQSTVLKVGHHGSRTSTSEAFLDTVNPAYAVISCGKDNSYGHPHDITLAKLQSKDIEVFRTDEMGDIYCTSDGKDVTFTYGEYHQAAESTTTDTVEVEESQQKDTTVSTYVLNTNSMKFHKPDCSAVAQMSDANRKDYTGSRDDLIEQGYTPCGYCKP